MEVRASVLTCKSLVQAGFSGERPIEPPGSWFLPKSSSEELKPTRFVWPTMTVPLRVEMRSPDRPRPSRVRMAACKANDQSALGGIPGADGGFFFSFFFEEGKKARAAAVLKAAVATARAPPLNYSQTIKRRPSAKRSEALVGNQPPG